MKTNATTTGVKSALRAKTARQELRDMVAAMPHPDWKPLKVPAYPRQAERDAYRSIPSLIR
jgi:hypothetical protein